MTFFDHLMVLVFTVGVIVAARNVVPGMLLWLVGGTVFLVFSVIARVWIVGSESKPSPNARACTYRESPNALIIECTVAKRGVP